MPSHNANGEKKHFKVEHEFHEKNFQFETILTYIHKIESGRWFEDSKGKLN